MPLSLEYFLLSLKQNSRNVYLLYKHLYLECVFRVMWFYSGCVNV